MTFSRYSCDAVSDQEVLRRLDSHHRAGTMTRREQSDHNVFFLPGKRQKRKLTVNRSHRQSNCQTRQTYHTSPDASSTREICVGLSSSRGTWERRQVNWIWSLQPPQTMTAETHNVLPPEGVFRVVQQEFFSHIRAIESDCAAGNTRSRGRKSAFYHFIWLPTATPNTSIATDCITTTLQ